MRIVGGSRWCPERRREGCTWHAEELRVHVVVHAIDVVEVRKEVIERRERGGTERRLRTHGGSPREEWVVR